MSRWYYDCPIKAVYMSKYHGIGFSKDGLFDAYSLYASKITLGGMFASAEPVQMICTDNGKYRFYIHPDSLPLLEPKVGDLLIETTAENDATRRVYIVDDDGYFSHCTLLEAEAWVEDGFMKIIQRNGVPFMWPEQEKE